VAYGADNNYIILRNVSINGILCDSNTFGGDPAVNYSKACYRSVVSSTGGYTDPGGYQNEPPIGFQFLANENSSFYTLPQTSAPGGIYYHAFGARNKYNVRTFSFLNGNSGYTCSGSDFILPDPAPGVLKVCNFTTSVGPGGYQACALEGQTCSLPSANQWVLFGNQLPGGQAPPQVPNGRYIARTVPGTSVVCGNSFFGDPVPNTQKFCFKR
jgi:hypothetical protein